MLTIGYSTRKHNPEFIEYLKKSSGYKKIEVIEKINNGEKSLSETYNEILAESKTDIVALCHDDIYFDTNSWYSKIISHFEKSDYGILGVAGTTFMPKSGMWWEDRSKMIGIVNHESEGKKWESKYSSGFGNGIKESVVVDGVFLMINKSKLKKNFDDTVVGFHFYDIEFCFRNFVEGVKIGVISNIRITHKSIGMTNQQWEKNRTIFAEKYKNHLPKIILKKIGDKLRILISLSSEKESLYLIQSLQKQGHEIILISSDPKRMNPIYSKTGLNITPITNPPGFKVGDGVWSLQTQNGTQVSQPNTLYKISEPNFDIIILTEKNEVAQFCNFYPSTPKIYLKNEDEIFDVQKCHTSVKSCLPTNDLLTNFEILYDSANKQFDFSESKKIKILTGFSNKGGSTTSFINLTNFLNNKGFDCVLYGPHNWHLDKCKSGLSSELKVDESDILIVHFVTLQERPKCKKVYLSLHEKNLFQISNMKPFWDEVIFLHEEHKNYHRGYDGPYKIIPNLYENLEYKEKPELDLVAGIIGSIDENKQTHISIKRALEDGCSKIYVYGQINDEKYFNEFVKPLINGNVIFVGHFEGKQQMYDSIGRAYISSISEVASLVKQECKQTGTKFFGNKVTSYEPTNLTNEEIINKWIELF
jgi:hypothetical protein